MEAKKEDLTCTLKLKFIKGQTAAGKDVYAMVTFPHVNPEVADEDMYEVAALLGRLQKIDYAWRQLVLDCGVVDADAIVAIE